MAAMAPPTSSDRVKEETVRKATNALLKWKKKLQSQSNQIFEKEEEVDDFIYLTVTLKKITPKDLTLTPHKIPLPHSLHSQDSSLLNLCLIVDGKRITSEAAQKILKSQHTPFINQVLKLSKLKSDYKSFDSKKKLYDSFDVFVAVKNVVPLLPKVLGKVFYKKKRKVPVPVDFRVDGSNWKEEIERACKSSLLCLSGGTCSAVRVGRWGVTEGGEIVENVLKAIDGVLEIVPKKWSGIRCFHLKFSDSVALPIYDHQSAFQPNGDSNVGEVVGTKRKRTQVQGDSGIKK